jgi:hypothetical protein
MMFNPGDDFCQIQFLLPQEANSYFESVYKGISWPTEPTRLIRVERSIQPDPPNEFEVALNETTVTRVVRLLNIPETLDASIVRKFAEENGRVVENLLMGKDGTSGVSSENLALNEGLY